MKLLVERKIASSQYANNALIFVIEDDAHDSDDHVDEKSRHRVYRRTVREAKVGGPHFVQHREHGPNDRGSPRLLIAITTRWFECGSCIFRFVKGSSVTRVSLTFHFSVVNTAETS